MEAADSSPPAEVSRVAVQLLPFWAEQPAVWFTIILGLNYTANYLSK
jgi:hypothetical protein